MALPANISTGRVTGQFIVGVADGADADDEPDFIPAQGTIAFTASTPYLPNPTASPNPVTMLKTTIVAVLDGEGYLCTPSPTDPTSAGKRGIRLVATDDKDASVEGWTWNATPQFMDVNGTRLDSVISTFDFALPSNSTVDLTTVVKVPASQGIGVEQAQALAASAQAAAVRAAADAAAVKDKALANDAGVAGFIQDGTRTTVALAAAIGAEVAPKLDKTEAAATYAGRSEINAPAVRFDQFPVALTDIDSMNSSPITQDAVTTAPGGGQYAAFWGADRNPYVARMKEGSTTWQVFNLGALPGNPLNAPVPADGHNNLSIAVDGAGYIHVAGNVHAQPMNYVRSSRPRDITGWERPPMVGTLEDQTTYPQFIRLGDGGLLFFYRTGYSSDGDHVVNRYSTTTRKWERVNVFIKGRGWQPTAEHPYTNMNPYLNKIVRGGGPGGKRIHVWFMWRGTTDPATNHDLHYMYSDDECATWKDASGGALAMPVTGATTSTLITAGHLGQVNQSGASVGSDGVPHAVFRFDAPLNEIRHYWLSAGTFKYQVVAPSGDAGRPACMSTTDGRTYAIYSKAGVTTLQQLRPTLGEPQPIFPWEMGNWAPSFDTIAAGSNILRLMMAPSGLKGEGSYGGTLTMDLTPASLSKIATGASILPRPSPPAPLVNVVNVGGNTYSMTPGMFYGPSGSRGNSPEIANGGYRGHVITADRPGVIADATVQVTTAGGAGSKGRIVVYGLDGVVRAQSADFDTTTTGTRSGQLNLRLAKDESVVIGVLAHSSAGAGPKFTCLAGAHDPRLPNTTAAGFFSGYKNGYAITGSPVPAVDQAPTHFLAGATTDNTPIVVVKAG